MATADEAAREQFNTASARARLEAQELRDHDNAAVWAASQALSYCGGNELFTEKYNKRRAALAEGRGEAVRSDYARDFAHLEGLKKTR